MLSFSHDVRETRVKRRIFLGALAASWPLLAQAQQRTPSRTSPSKLYRIGYFAAEATPANARSVLRHFVLAMEKQGLIENTHFIVEPRYADFQYERLSELARELVQLNVDVIVATTGRTVQAAQSATSDIPIVMAVSIDPVRMGLVGSLARPGGNTTGLSGANDEAMAKQLELLAAIVPNLTRIGVLALPPPSTSGDPSLARTPSPLMLAARQREIAVHRFEVFDPSGFERAFESMVSANINGLLVASNFLFNSHRSRITALALANKIPAISQRREFAADGGLMSYGESAPEFGRRIAYYVDKILKGAKPADIPVELPTHFHFAINRATAQALGLSIPFQLQTLADEVIE